MNIALLVDIGVVLVLIISAGVSFFRGFIREVLTVFGVIGGAMAALMFGASLKPLMYGWFGVEKGKEPEKIFDLIPMNLAADIASYVSIFLLVFILLQLVSHFLSGAVRALGLGPVDRTLGVFFGIGRGILLLGILYLPFNLILPDDNKKEWFETSKTMFFVQNVSEWMAGFLPQEKEAKAKAESAVDKLEAIDVLGDKRITAPIITSGDDVKGDGKADAPTADGYSKSDRTGLENLIEEKLPETHPSNGHVNE